MHGHLWHGCNRCTGCAGWYCHHATVWADEGNVLMDAERTLPLTSDAFQGLMWTYVVMQPRQTHRDQHVTWSCHWGLMVPAVAEAGLHDVIRFHLLCPAHVVRTNGTGAKTAAAPACGTACE
jgi:hypothetical protein